MAESTKTPEGWTTRRAAHMERWTDIRPVVVKDCPEAHRLILKVGNQEFWIDSACGFYDTREEAEWARDMLCIALDAMSANPERSALLACEKALRELAAVLDNVNPWDDEHVAQYNVAWNATSAALSRLDSIRAEVSHGK